MYRYKNHIVHLLSVKVEKCTLLGNYCHYLLDSDLTTLHCAKFFNRTQCRDFIIFFSFKGRGESEEVINIKINVLVLSNKTISQ